MAALFTLSIESVQLLTGYGIFGLDDLFNYYSENNRIETLHIEKVEVSYELDSKGHYQPVYAFHGTADGIEMTILIPGI